MWYLTSLNEWESMSPSWKTMFTHTPSGFSWERTERLRCSIKIGQPTPPGYPHRKPLAILWSIPEGIPSLAQPILRCKEGIQRDELLGKTKTGSNRMRDAQLKRWRDFVMEQESVWTLWNGTSVGQHEVLKHWPLNTLRQHSQRKTSASIGAPGPTRQDNKLQRPLKKETTFPSR